LGPGTGHKNHPGSGMVENSWRDVDADAPDIFVHQFNLAGMKSDAVPELGPSPSSMLRHA
jgi:hypothetical protein